MTTAANPASPWLFPGQFADEHRSYSSASFSPASPPGRADWPYGANSPGNPLSARWASWRATAIRHAFPGGADWPACAARKPAPYVPVHAERVGHWVTRLRHRRARWSHRAWRMSRFRSGSSSGAPRNIGQSYSASFAAPGQAVVHTARPQSWSGAMHISRCRPVVQAPHYVAVVTVLAARLDATVVVTERWIAYPPNTAGTTLSALFTNSTPLPLATC
jgi:hypothetical protein